MPIHLVRNMLLYEHVTWEQFDLFFDTLMSSLLPGTGSRYIHHQFCIVYINIYVSLLIKIQNKLQFYIIHV